LMLGMLERIMAKAKEDKSGSPKGPDI
jgi:hypothetical protein